MAANFFDFQIAQAEVYAQFSVVSNFSIVKLDGDLIRLGWNIEDKYATLSSYTEARIDGEISMRLVLFGSFLNFRCGHDF